MSADEPLLQKRFKPREGRVTSRELEGETILLDLQADVYYYLGTTGSRAWALMGGGQTGQQVAQALFEEYDAPLDQIEADILQLFTDLLAMGLVEEVGG